MPEKETMERVREDQRKGKSASTQAGEFVREEMDHIRQGKHGARSSKQAIAIGLSKARRAGVQLPPPKAGSQSSQVHHKAEHDLEKGAASAHKKPSANRSRAAARALKKERHGAASRASLSRQAKSTARQRGAAARHEAAMKAVRTKGMSRLRQAAKKAARTRSREKRAA